jgi:hypothetical protein
MNFPDEEQAIRKAFLDGVAASAYPNTPVAWEGVDFPPPDQSTGSVPDTPPEYFRLSILRGSGNQVEVGGFDPLLRYAGVVQVVVHTQEGKGEQPGLKMANAVAAIFCRKTLEALNSGPIRTFVPGITGPIYTQTGMEYIVSTNYQRDTRAGA